MMFGLLTASYVLAMATFEKCPSEVREVPTRNETIVFKCVLPENKMPFPKEPDRVQTETPKQEVLTRMTQANTKKGNIYKKKTKKRKGKRK